MGLPVKKKSIDYDEVFAPVTKWKVVALASSHQWPIFHLNVKTAFLRGDLKESVYMEVPEDFRHSTTHKKVCRLKKFPYGLKQWAQTSSPCMIQENQYISRRSWSLKY